MKDFYQAMLARDQRFDGKFFVAVKTTGIYCRPICPARPKRENVEFFPDAASAESAGYRPCLRCRPQCAPVTAAWQGRRALVRRALRLLAENRRYQTSEELFAERLGVSARHLRRLFMAELGQTPKQISDNQRLDFARKLIVETHLPILTVAQTAGFGSLRRFNDAFRKRFRRPPSKLRNVLSRGNTGEGIELKLSFTPPYDWQSLIQFYRTHTIPGVERVAGNSFERVFRIDGSMGFFRVEPIAGTHQLKLTVVTEDLRGLFEVASRVRRMFDLDSNPGLIAECFAQDPLLGKLCRRYPGLRLPGGWDPFETAVCSILGQAVSAEQRSNLVAQVVQSYGEPVVHPRSGERAYLFPRPDVLAQSDLEKIGTTAARKEAIRAFSARVLSGSISLSQAQEPAIFRKALLETKGLGAWSAEYISLRAIGDTDAFPRTDLILKRVLKLSPELDLEKLKPWRSYAAIYLWKAFADKLSNKRRKRKHDALLQRNKFPGGQTHSRRQREKVARRRVGDEVGESKAARSADARSAPPDFARNRATTR
jgi:AraC family transcriptional regulator, regulatory protein of adaptative response / DNA-3-methyladenine glycosylase II